jgi:predicted nucleic acid-binding protein
VRRLDAAFAVATAFQGGVKPAHSKAPPAQPFAEQQTGTILQLTHVAQAYGLTSYDAAYLDLAARLRLPLATTDKSLRRAAQVVGVEMVAP